MKYLWTDREILNDAYRLAFNMLNVPLEQQWEARNWHSIQKEVNDIMLYKLKGRPQPLKNRGPLPNFEASRLNNPKSLFLGSYPKKLIKDTDKLKWLKNIFNQKEMKLGLYLELSLMLNVKEKDVYEVIDIDFI